MLDEKHSVPHTLTSFIEIAIENKNVFFVELKVLQKNFPVFFSRIFIHSI